MFIVIHLNLRFTSLMRNRPYIFRLSPQGGMNFDGATRLTDTHDAVQARAGNATWVNEFNSIVKSPGKLIAETMLWLCHSLAVN